MLVEHRSTNIDNLFNFLVSSVKVTFDIEDVLQDCQKLKAELKNDRDDSALLSVWILETSFGICRHYASAFSLLKERKYYDAWTDFEKIEIAISNIRFNSELFEKLTLLKIIEENTKRFQALFPYRIFSSPEYLKLSQECSICGSDLNPFTGCNHIPGKVYLGEICHCIVNEAKLLSISMVEHPVQKYSVMFDDINNPEKYKVLEYLVPKLTHGFIKWSFTIKTKYTSHSEYSIGRNDKCPCNSGVKYKYCCLKDSRGVKYPHYEFVGPDAIFGNYNLLTKFST